MEMLWELYSKRNENEKGSKWKNRMANLMSRAFLKKRETKLWAKLSETERNARLPENGFPVNFEGSKLPLPE